MARLRLMVFGTLLLSTAIAACGTKEEATTNRGASALIDPASETHRDTKSPRNHYKVHVVFEQGTFRVVDLIPVQTGLHQRRGGPSDTGIRFVARQGTQAVHGGLLPDVRIPRAETADPVTGKLEYHVLAEERPVHLLLDVPQGTERVDFYDARGLPSPPPPSEESGGPRPIGSIDLRDLTEVLP